MPVSAKPAADRPRGTQYELLPRHVERPLAASTWTADAADARQWWTDRANSTKISPQDLAATMLHTPMPTKHSEGATMAYEGVTRKH